MWAGNNRNIFSLLHLVIGVTSENSWLEFNAQVGCGGSCQPEHLHMAFSWGLGFLTAWHPELIISREKKPRRRSITFSNTTSEIPVSLPPHSVQWKQVTNSPYTRQGEWESTFWWLKGILFIIARTWKQPRCPSEDEWMRKLWYIYTMEYYSAIKKNSFESILMRWMKLEPIIQSEVSQKDKDQYSILTHIYGI